MAATATPAQQVNVRIWSLEPNQKMVGRMNQCAAPVCCATAGR
jgi:hypothetical protein